MSSPGEFHPTASYASDQPAPEDLGFRLRDLGNPGDYVIGRAEAGMDSKIEDSIKRLADQAGDTQNANPSLSFDSATTALHGIERAKGSIFSHLRKRLWHGPSYQAIKPSLTHAALAKAGKVKPLGKHLEEKEAELEALLAGPQLTEEEQLRWGPTIDPRNVRGLKQQMLDASTVIGFSRATAEQLIRSSGVAVHPKLVKTYFGEPPINVPRPVVKRVNFLLGLSGDRLDELDAILPERHLVGRAAVTPPPTPNMGESGTKEDMSAMELALRYLGGEFREDEEKRGIPIPRMSKRGLESLFRRMGYGIGHEDTEIKAIAADIYRQLRAEGILEGSLRVPKGGFVADTDEYGLTVKLDELHKALDGLTNDGGEHDPKDTDPDESAYHHTDEPDTIESRRKPEDMSAEELALRYIGGEFRKSDQRGTPFPRMSEESLMSMYKRMWPDIGRDDSEIEALVSDIYRQLQDKGVVAMSPIPDEGFIVNPDALHSALDELAYGGQPLPPSAVIDVKATEAPKSTTEPEEKTDENSAKVDKKHRARGSRGHGQANATEEDDESDDGNPDSLAPIDPGWESFVAPANVKSLRQAINHSIVQELLAQAKPAHQLTPTERAAINSKVALTHLAAYFGLANSDQLDTIPHVVLDRVMDLLDMSEEELEQELSKTQQHR